MPDKKKNLKFWLINAAIFLLLFLLQYNGNFSLNIKHATPMLALSAVLCVSVFTSELHAVVFALFAGILTDGASSTPVCFNTVIMILLALATSLTVHYLFNINIRSTAVIAILGSSIYFLLRWLLVVSSGSFESEIRYLLIYALPSVIYTAAVIIPLYFIEKKISEKFYVR